MGQPAGERPKWQTRRMWQPLPTPSTPLMNWYLGPLKKYADIHGRASRKEYWLFVVTNIFVIFILEVISPQIGTVYSFAILLPMATVGVRRLHDTNHRGRWWLLNLIPIANIWILALMVIKGTVGDNDYGPDPLSRSKPQTQGSDETYRPESDETYWPGPDETDWPWPDETD